MTVRFLLGTPPVPGFDDMTGSDIFTPNTRDWDVIVIREAFSEDDCKRILKTASALTGVEDRRV